MTDIEQFQPGLGPVSTCQLKPIESIKGTNRSSLNSAEACPLAVKISVPVTTPRMWAPRSDRRLVFARVSVNPIHGFADQPDGQEEHSASFARPDARRPTKGGVAGPECAD